MTNHIELEKVPLRKFLVYWTEGDFTGSSDEYKVVEAKYPAQALNIIIKKLDEELKKKTLGYSAYYENVKVYYPAPKCMCQFKGKDRRDLECAKTTTEKS